MSTANNRQASTEHLPMYYVYVLTRRDARRPGDIYIGYTKNIERRVKEHEGKNPVLAYYEAYSNEEDVQNRERKLKQRGQAVRRLKERIAHSLH